MDLLYEPDKGSFEHGEHTADIWLLARGDTFSELIRNMLEGLYGTISEAYAIEGDSERFTLVIKTGSYEELLVEALTEALFLLGSESVLILVTELDLTIDSSDRMLNLTMIGAKAKVSIVQERQGMEVKAVTRHGTSINFEDGLWSARVLLDI